MSRVPDRTEGDVNASPHRAAWQDEHLDAETRALLDEDARWFLHQSLSTPCLNALAACEGATITDLQGREYLDFHGNSAHQVGYGHPRVLEAVRRQLDALPFCPRRYTNRPAVDLAARLGGRMPGGPGKVLFAPGGTAAVGIALKLARIATGRFKTLSWWDAFHGASLDAISVGGEALFREGIGPLLPGSIHVPPPGARLPGGRRVPSDEAADYAEYVFAREPDIAAFIAEPFRCTTVDVPGPDYWPRIRALCDRYGALLVFDEIPICLGRTGRFFACEHFGAAPDLLCLGKGLGGGVMPMAALLARAGLDVAAHTALGHYTHEKSPVGAAAALATLDVIDEEGLAGRAATAGAAWREQLAARLGRHAAVGEVRGLGLVVGVEIVDPANGAGPDPDRAERILYGALSRGLSFKVSGGNVLTLMPPLTVSDAELAQATDILDASVGASGGAES